VRVQTVCLDLSDRLFTLDMYRMNSTYHVEITNSSETILFPCSDKEEQIRIFKQIKEFLLGLQSYG
jgi:hypothetical protein